MRATIAALLVVLLVPHEHRREQTCTADDENNPAPLDLHTLHGGVDESTKRIFSKLTLHLRATFRQSAEHVEKRETFNGQRGQPCRK